MGQPLRKLRLGLAVIAALAVAALTLAPQCASWSASPGGFTLAEASGAATASFFAAGNYSEARNPEVTGALAVGTPIVFHGPGAERLIDLAEPALTPTNIEGATVVGVWRHASGAVSVLVIRDANPGPIDLAPAVRWAQEPPEEPGGDQAVALIGVLTEIDLHMPAGTLVSRTEALRVAEDSPDGDLYEFGVTQTLTPGAHTGESQWRWTRLEYSAGGGPGSGLELASYAPLPDDAQPRGLFTLLWRIMTFRWGGLLDWLLAGEGKTWADLSDRAAGLYAVVAEAPQGSEDAALPLEARHQYVVRAREGEAPVVHRWTQATYRKGATGVESYSTPRLGGPLAVRPQPS